MGCRDRGGASRNYTVTRSALPPRLSGPKQTSFVAPGTVERRTWQADPALLPSELASRHSKNSCMLALTTERLPATLPIGRLSLHRSVWHPATCCSTTTSPGISKSFTVCWNWRIHRMNEQQLTPFFWHLSSMPKLSQCHTITVLHHMFPPPILLTAASVFVQQ